jgi:hypothetical protein
MRSQGEKNTVHLVSGFGGFLLLVAMFSLPGCQSSQDQRIEEAKELIHQKQMLDTQYGKPGANRTSPPPVVSPATPTDPSKTEKAPSTEALELPLYPGARSVSHLGNSGDGIAMELLETSDRIDGVLAFYQEKMKAAAGKIPPSTAEEKRDGGRRIVRISKPRDDGGLLTVEVGEEPGKTTIQLMSVSPGKPAPVPTPAAPGTAGSSSVIGPPSTSGATAPVPPRP